MDKIQTQTQASIGWGALALNRSGFYNYSILDLRLDMAADGGGTTQGIKQTPPRLFTLKHHDVGDHEWALTKMRDRACVCVSVHICARARALTHAKKVRHLPSTTTVLPPTTDGESENPEPGKSFASQRVNEPMASVIRESLIIALHRAIASTLLPSLQLLSLLFSRSTWPFRRSTSQRSETLSHSIKAPLPLARLNQAPGH